MEIDFNKACKAMERQLKLATDEHNSKIIAEFMHDKCHYFTVVTAEQLDLREVTIFHLKSSGRIIHSAVAIGDNTVMDALGNRTADEVEAVYDAMNSFTGIYHAEGQCVSSSLSLSDFDPDQFYTEPLSDLSEVKKRALKWLKRLGEL